MSAETIIRTGPYNMADDLIGRNLVKHPGKTAFIDPDGAYSFQEVAERADRAGAALLALGLSPRDRVVVCLLDGIDFVATFLGAIKAGLAPIALNTLFSPDDYAYVLTDSGARGAVVSEAVGERFTEGARRASWAGRLVVAGGVQDGPGLTLSALAGTGPSVAATYPSQAEEVAFWLYSSGSTGRPKGVPHRHASPLLTAELFARDTLGLREDDVIYSAAKLFFAYGLGNALTFPMALGATAVLRPDRVTPEMAQRVLADHGVTVFCGVPTLYGALLASPRPPGKGEGALRLCLSAGEALPAEIGRSWTARTGIEVVDGIGSTEMLHVYVSNRPGDVRYGTTGRAAPGYDVKLIDEQGGLARPGELGELYVRGPTMTPGYWNQPDLSAATFVDGWMKTGDKFVQDAEGRLTHQGRADDMLKVSGIWVSPGEVENALLAHDAVLEAAVIGVPDDAGLVKTKAFVVTRAGAAQDEALARELKSFVKARLTPHKYPRSIAFVDQLPKTATGKIRRHLLREQQARPAQAPSL
jgi:benzoate-CoA ligase